jgi:hypothetical protein
MSYRRTFSKRIGVRYSGSVSYHYPASQSGGSGTAHYSGTTYEDVHVNIDVDTDPFDRSVVGVNNNVDVLTGAVVATEVAQIASIDNNAKKVGTAIVDGFFKTIRSEITQQIAALNSQVDATLLLLREWAKRCTDKQLQMSADYGRIANRYLKIFNDLNHELDNRIFELDKPAFAFKREADGATQRSLAGNLAGTAAVFGAEGGDLQVKISISLLKKRALDTVGKTHAFLLKRQRMNRLIFQSMLNESRAATRYAPVCYLETNDGENRTLQQIFPSRLLPEMKDERTANPLLSMTWTDIPAADQDVLRRYFHAETGNMPPSTDKHDIRVRQTIAQLFNIHQTKSIYSESQTK